MPVSVKPASVQPTGTGTDPLSQAKRTLELIALDSLRDQNTQPKIEAKLLQTQMLKRSDGAWYTRALDRTAAATHDVLESVNGTQKTYAQVEARLSYRTALQRLLVGLLSPTEDLPLPAEQLELYRTRVLGARSETETVTALQAILAELPGEVANSLYKNAERREQPGVKVAPELNLRSAREEFEHYQKRTYTNTPLSVQSSLETLERDRGTAPNPDAILVEGKLAEAKRLGNFGQYSSSKGLLFNVLGDEVNEALSQISTTERQALRDKVNKELTRQNAPSDLQDALSEQKTVMLKLLRERALASGRTVSEEEASKIIDSQIAAQGKGLGEDAFNRALEQELIKRLLKNNPHGKPGFSSIKARALGELENNYLDGRFLQYSREERDAFTETVLQGALIAVSGGISGVAAKGVSTQLLRTTGSRLLSGGAGLITNGATFEAALSVLKTPTEGSAAWAKLPERMLHSIGMFASLEAGKLIWNNTGRELLSKAYGVDATILVNGMTIKQLSASGEFLSKLGSFATEVSAFANYGLGVEELNALVDGRPLGEDIVERLGKHHAESLKTLVALKIGAKTVAPMIKTSLAKMGSTGAELLAKIEQLGRGSSERTSATERDAPSGVTDKPGLAPEGASVADRNYREVELPPPGSQETPYQLQQARARGEQEAKGKPSQDNSAQSISPETERKIDEWVHELKRAGISINQPQESVLRRKLIGHINKHGNGATLNIATLRDAIAESPTFFEPNNKQGVTKLLENHHKNTERRIKEILADRAKNPPSFDPTVMELETTSGNYTLERLINTRHLENESASMKHCVGNGDHYINEITKGKIEIFSLRDKRTGQSVLTIEYGKKDKLIRQVKGFKDALITGAEPYFRDLLEAVEHIDKSVDNQGKPRGVNHVKDMGAVSIPENSILLASGEILAWREIARRKNPLIIKGDIKVDKSFSNQELDQLSKLNGVTGDFTGATKEQKDFIMSFNGSIVDRSENVSYTNLTSVLGFLDFKDAKTIALQNLTSVGGTLDADSATTLDLRSLASVGDSLYTNSATTIDLRSLISVGEGILANHATSVDLRSLTSVGEALNVNSATTLDLRNLTSVGRTLSAYSAKTLDLRSLTSVGGDLSAESAKTIDLRSLSSVGETLYANSATTLDLRNLTTVGETLYANSATTLDLRNLTAVLGRIDAGQATTIDLRRLTSVGGTLYAGRATTIDLRNLTSVAGLLDTRSATNLDLRNLTSVYGSLDARSATTIDLRNLTFVEQTIYANSAIRLDVRNLTDVGEIVISPTTEISAPNIDKSLIKVMNPK